jgi:hypothetical protein
MQPSVVNALPPLEPMKAMLKPHVFSMGPWSPEQHDAEKKRPHSEGDHRQGMLNDSSVTNEVRRYSDDK